MAEEHKQTVVATDCLCITQTDRYTQTVRDYPHLCIQSVTELIWRWHLEIEFTVSTATAQEYCMNTASFAVSA